MITQLTPQTAALTKQADGAAPVTTVAPAAGVLQFRIFSILWAVAALFHMAHSSVFDIQLNLAVLTLAAFFVIFRPSLRSCLLLVLLQIFDAIFRMPFTTNHWIFAAFVNFTLLQSLVYLVFKYRSFEVREGELFKLFAPVARIELIILYFFAVFHKLNSGFFDPAASCATDLLIAQNLGLVLPLNEEIFAFNAYLTLIIELLIPLLLCFRRTRMAGVVVGLIFHFVLSYSTYNAFFDFSSVMFAVYFLFLVPEFSAYVYKNLHRFRRLLKTLLRNFSIRKLIYFGAFATLVLGGFYVLNKQLDSYQRVHLFFWTVYSLLFGVCVVGYMMRRTKLAFAHKHTFRIAHWSLLIVPLIVFFNGALPYLGLKTENSYAMFSNLRTEGGETNHFIVPVSAQLFGYQKEVVEIVSSTDPYLRQLAEQNLALVLFEFRNYVNERRPERVEYVLNGEKRTFVRSEKVSSQELGKNPYILQKLMKFRPFAVEGPQPCEH